MHAQFGGRITPALEKRYGESPQWQGNSFQNLEHTSMAFSASKIPGLIYKGLFRREGRSPVSNLPIDTLNREAFLAEEKGLKFCWYGHSVLLLRFQGKTILIDPMLGPNAAPISPVPVKRFSLNTLDIIDALPPIDLILLSHDHYDHLDLASIRLLAGKTALFLVALGTARHLIAWGIGPERITEMDWWAHAHVEGIDIHFTPTRHFSGRGLRDRQKSLWGGWVLRSATHSIYFSGDSGYGAHFSAVGKTLGPFDFGFMECGQYNENWHQIHMFPEESVQAALDAGVRKAMPVHWGAFSLALHGWKEPVNRFVQRANQLRLPLLIPRLGALAALQDNYQHPWWEEIT